MKKIVSTRILFYSIWLLISFVQAAGTELFDDEAYYWVYSKFLDWGYFDHPPMIAVLIKLGTLIFSEELGVRFFVVVIGTLSVFIIEKLTNPVNLKLFYAIVLNTAILQIGGIIAVPDIPLLFFTALFFWMYKKYLEQINWMNAVLLSITVALLLYSKYHGLLIILATLVSNFKLLKQPATWLVIVLAILFFMPHVLWQLEHGLPSLNYHLFERVSPAYSLSFTTDYLAGQLLIAGPLLGWLLIWSAFRYKPTDQTQKAMRWSLVFVFLLFLASSFKSRTEANWTVPLLVPLIVLGYQYIDANNSLRKWVYRLLPFSIILILFVRVFMIIDTPLIKNLPKDEFHYNREWTKKVKENAHGLPVVFTNSYQRASKYWFYTGDTAFSLNTHLYRRSNYNFWPLEMQLQNKDVFMVGSKGTSDLTHEINSGNKEFSVDTIQNFSSYSQVILTQSSLSFDKANLTIATTLDVNAPSANILNYAFSQRPEIILIVYPGKKQQPILINTGKYLYNISGSAIGVKASLPVIDGKVYQFRWGLKGSYVEPTINSSVSKLSID
jgi:hypothetical protein